MATLAFFGERDWRKYKEVSYTDGLNSSQLLDKRVDEYYRGFIPITVAFRFQGIEPRVSRLSLADYIDCEVIETNRPRVFLGVEAICSLRGFLDQTHGCHDQIGVVPCWLAIR